MKISVFTIVKNEAEYIGYGIMSVLDYVDELVYADGNSTDGTLEIIEFIKHKYDKDDKIKLFKDKDCKDLREDYQKLFQWTLEQCKGDYVWFLHPDMICINPETIRQQILKGVRYNVNVISLAGEDREKIITGGRSYKWYPIYKNDFGLHFYGYYGSDDEDFYFKAFTGDEHIFWSKKKFLPYRIEDTNITLYHFCDCKPYKRRLERMINILKINNPEATEEQCKEVAVNHPRVNLKDSIYQDKQFRFEEFKGDYPEVFSKYREFEKLRRGADEDIKCSCGT